MARQQSRATIQAEILSLQKKLANLDKAQAERIGRFAVKAGLASLDLTDAQLTEGLSELARRFREAGVSESEGGSEPQGDGASDPAAKSSRSSKTAHEGEE